jgi:hypothetical protein
MAVNNLGRLEFPHGVYADIWLTNEKVIGKLIDKHGLKPKPVPPRILRQPEAADAVRTIDLGWPIDFPGGIRVPHFHYQGELYLVKPKQWREFSKAVVKDLSSRLADAGRVSLPELLDISNSVGPLMR